MSVTNKPAIEAFIGASGSGKGVSINERLRELAPRRLILFDPRDEYGRWAPAVSDPMAVVRALRKAGDGPVRLRYVPDGRFPLDGAFAVICRAVFQAGNLTFVAEELSNVTKPSYAPPAWRILSSQGRHKGLHILGAAQRPTMIDKDFLGNCTRVRVFMLGYDNDMKAMAKEVRAPVEELEALFTSDNGIEGDGKVTTIQGLEYQRRERKLERITIVVKKSGAKLTRAPFGADEPRKPAAKRRTAREAT